MTATKRVIVVAAAESLESTAVREKLHLDGCGSIVSFLGITRGVDDGVEIKRLEFDAWEEKLPQVLSNLGHEALSKFGVSSVSMAHRTGSVGPS